MSEPNRETLRALLRRVDEVRGLSDRSAASATESVDDTTAVVRTLGEVIEELERSHRRLIETNVQLVSLREVAGSLAGATDAVEASQFVTRYLQRAFGFEHVCLLLIDRERGALTGAWSGGPSVPGETVGVDVPLVGGRGALARTVWLNRTLLFQDCLRHPPAHLPAEHPLSEAFGRLGSMVSVPLQRSPVTPPAEACEACALGDADLLAPPPGPAAERWAGEREEMQRRCMSCRQFSCMGVIAAARRSGVTPLTAADVTLIESIALSIAPMVENARLFQELRRSQRFQQDVLDSMASSLVAVNLRAEVLSVNRAAEDLVGWPEAEALGRPVGEALGEECEALVLDVIGQGHDIHRLETEVRRRDGGRIPVRLTVSRLRDDAGNGYGAIVTFLDLTPIRRAEEHARQMDRLAALGRFTSSVAHEIRNPLTGIGMGVQHLARAIADDAGQRENLEFILSEVRRLDRIVQQLFDVTHPRRLDLRVRPLEDTLRRAHHSLEAMLQGQSVRVQFQVDTIPAEVAHDWDQMQQVFINLIKNAAEAAGDGATITLRLSTAPADPRKPGSGSAVVTIADDGPGFDEATGRRLFEPFFSTKPGGTGLGLYITHEIVKQHGGSLTATSEPGRGATFRVELPRDTHGGKS